MWRRRLIWIWLGWTLTLTLPGRADVPSAGSSWAIESELLHRRLRIDDLQAWTPSQQRWQPRALDSVPVTVLHLWSPRCVPCVEELPLLARLLDAWKSEPSVRFLVVADHEGDGSELLPFLSAQPLLWRNRPLLRLGTDRLRDGLGVSVQPLTLLVDEQRVIRQAFVGPLSGRSLGSAISRLLATRASSSQQ